MERGERGDGKGTLEIKVTESDAKRRQREMDRGRRRGDEPKTGADLLCVVCGACSRMMIQARVRRELNRFDPNRAAETGR